MKIIEKATTPNGIKIQLEDWRENLYGFTIGAYPIAKNSSYFIIKGKNFRLDISANKTTNYTNDDIKRDFEALKSGEKTLKDLASHFWNGKKDMYYLGMEVDYIEH